MKNILHPNAKNIELEDSIYKLLYTDPNYFFYLVRDLVLEWRNKKKT